VKLLASALHHRPDGAARKTQKGPEGPFCNTTDNYEQAQCSSGRGAGKCQSDEAGGFSDKAPTGWDEKRPAAGRAWHGVKTPDSGPKLHSVLMNGRRGRMSGICRPCPAGGEGCRA